MKNVAVTPEEPGTLPHSVALRWLETGGFASTLPGTFRFGSQPWLDITSTWIALCAFGGCLLAVALMTLFV